MEETFTERKLATIRRIKATNPIANADNIEVAIVDGWQVVAKKGEFKAGDLCVYFEIDSFLPVEERFEFLRKSCFRVVAGLGEGFRLKTIKLRGELSQGLALPLPSLCLQLDTLEIGYDLTEMLRVRKYEAPIPMPNLGRSMQMLPKGNFPSFMRRTDQERIQNCFDTLVEREDIAALRFEVTLKMDGSSMTVFLNDHDQFGVCSRNLELKEPTGDAVNTFWLVGRMMHMEERLRRVGRHIGLQGALMGPGINSNRERFTQFTFYLFAIYDIDQQHYLLPAERVKLLEELNADSLEPKILHAPIIEAGFDFSTTLPTIQAALAYADRPSLVHPIAEGVVLKCNTMAGLTFKIINNKYLLKCEE